MTLPCDMDKVDVCYLITTSNSWELSNIPEIANGLRRNEYPSSSLNLSLSDERKEAKGCWKESLRCELCCKCFTSRSNLNQHLKIHMGEKQFKCIVCDKQFTQKGALKGHYSMHSGDKPFTCDVCGKQFTQRQNLQKHSRVHSGIKMFK